MTSRRKITSDNGVDKAQALVAAAISVLAIGAATMLAIGIINAPSPQEQRGPAYAETLVVVRIAVHALAAVALLSMLLLAISSARKK